MLEVAIKDKSVIALFRFPNLHLFFRVFIAIHDIFCLQNNVEQ